jgi:glycosyltransferase involved in cell wall biosynthesis
VEGRRSFTIIFIGSLKPWHGVLELLEAFLILGGAASGFRLVIVGDGPLGSQVRDAASTHDGVEWCGAVAHAEVAERIAEADAAVAPYLEDEDGYFCPLKVLEYQAMGVPVVASGGQGVRDLIRDGETGLLVPPGDAKALAVALIRLKEDPVLAHRLGESGRKAVSQRTWGRNARRVLEEWDLWSRGSRGDEETEVTAEAGRVGR